MLQEDSRPALRKQYIQAREALSPEERETYSRRAAERIAAGHADTVCLAVGLHNGYGAAQRMYVKRGYIPDGSGAWYRGKNCTPYDTVYTNDDDLVLYLSKKLPGQEKTGGGDPL